MRSVRDKVRRGAGRVPGAAMRPLALAACVCLLGAGASGCSTTQDKARTQKARAEHILKARAEREAAQKRAKRKRHDRKKEKRK